MAVTIGLAVVGVVMSVVGIAKKDKAMTDQRNIATGQLLQQGQLSEQKNQTDITVGQGHDISNIFGSTIQAVTQAQSAQQTALIQAQSDRQVASLNKQGNLLLIVGMGVVVLTLGELVLRKKT